MKKTPYKKAFDKWWSEKGEVASKAASLRTNHPDYYLGNRLKRAFQEGYNAAQKDAAALNEQPA